MISSAQVLTAPCTTRRSRVLTYAAPRGYAFPTRVSVNPKLVIAASTISLIALVVIILTHMGTYDVALTRFSAQTDVQATVTTKPQATQIASQPASTTINASKALMRLDQTNANQYNSQAEYNTWSPSACSAASMTEVINSYGHSYKITDVLKVESGIGAITPDQGLLYPQGIDQTAAKFGFATQTLNNPTLDQVLALANGGKPVIVNFPPQTWAGGHFLVVVGGNTISGTAYVHLADSSTINMQYMKRDRFLYYWKGLAKVLTPKAVNTTAASNNQYAVSGKPTLSASFINQVFAAYNSPAQGKGQALYDLGVQDGIDPAFALAFFLHESSFGTSGEATITLSLGNMRCIPNTACVNTAGQTCLSKNESCYAAFSSWEDGFKAWYALMRNLYVAQWGLTTVDTIIPKYAPSADNNNEQAYITAIKQAIDTWHSGAVLV